MATSATAHATRHSHGPRHPQRGNASPRRSADGQVVGVLFMVFGLGWLLRVSGAVELGWESLLSVVLIVLGVGMAITARARRGGILMVLGIFLTISLATTSSVGEIDMGRGVGERRIAPRTVAELQPSYRLLAGDLRLDLTNLSFSPGEPRAVDARVTFGELQVTVPHDMLVDITATARVGQVRLFDRRSDGTVLDMRYVDDDFDPERGLVLQLSTAAGEVRVIRAPAPARFSELEPPESNGASDAAD